MASRRDHALSVMRRLADEKLRDEAQGLGALRAKIGALRQGQERILSRLETEAHVGGIETAPYVGSFVRAMRAEHARMETEARGLERRAAEQQDRVMERFREQQVFTRLEAAEAEARADEATRRETAALEEAALTRWRRG
ncbi:hypothetical protein V8J36_19650 [Frigidibacter sp. MR17.14]|uniref:hypothetical protein n=1 Tax=Frigidibacter sp. MR17.14 TaxID=3126509 RepID=UPI003012B252